MHAAPTSEPRPATALPGGPGGVWARDIPVHRRAVPGHRHGRTQAALLLKPAARSSVVGWLLGVWGGGIRRCDTGNGRTIAWSAHDDEFSSRVGH